MAQDPSEAQQMAMLMNLLKQQQPGKAEEKPQGPTWRVVTEIVNVDSKTSTMSTDLFSKTITQQNPILSDHFVTNQIDSGADLLFKLEFSEKIKIETITFYCKPHSEPSKPDTNTDTNVDNHNNNNDEDANPNENDDDTSMNNNDSNENKDDTTTAATEANEENESGLKPLCPTRLYFCKSEEALSNYFENTINSRDDSFGDALTLIKLNENELQSSNGFEISFSNKQRPKVYKGSGLRTKELIFGFTHEPTKLDDDDDDDTDYDMDGDEKYQTKSIYVSGIVIRAAGQLSSKQDFEAQRKQIEKIKKGD